MYKGGNTVIRVSAQSVTKTTEYLQHADFE